MRFDDFNLDASIIEAISYMNFTEATPVQEQAIPAILQGRDLIACAQTGTGKTAAFVLPVLNSLVQHPNDGVDTVIIVPTRELAIQIDQQIQGFSYFINIGSQAIYGGGDAVSYAEQERALKEGRDIIVATPGRLISHLAQGYVNFKSVRHLILDEADKMLDMGFLDDIEKIVTYMPKEGRQTLMFSATMPDKIRALAKKILHAPHEINLGIAKPAEGVNQSVALCYDPQKNPLLIHILKDLKPNMNSVIVFTSAKMKVNEIVQTLRRSGVKAAGMSSVLSQDQREEVLMQFKAHRLRVLVATDIMSRGIDIKGIDLVINYDAPHDAEDYVHRIGRTARAGSEGDAITLINPRDMERFDRIEKLIEQNVPRLTIPTEMGDQPAWNPAPQRGGKGRPHGGNNRHGKGPARGENRRNGERNGRHGHNHHGKRPSVNKDKQA